MLIESQLFGYVDGAFTGGRRGGAAGVIEQAHGGTLLLDEIGDMPAALQCRLLRVLQNRTVTRIGETRETPVDIIVICATHRLLDALVSEGRFREDLYYRLNGYTVLLPPLRKRADLGAIIRGLFRRWGAEGADDSTFDVHRLIDPAALERLMRHAWPGNIRQLKQTIRSMLALRTGDAALSTEDLPDFLRSACRDAAPPAAAAGRQMDAMQIHAIRAALEEHEGNISLAARSLGVSRGTVYSKLKRFGLSTRRTIRGA